MGVGGWWSLFYYEGFCGAMIVTLIASMIKFCDAGFDPVVYGRFVVGVSVVFAFCLVFSEHCCKIHHRSVWKI